MLEKEEVISDGFLRTLEEIEFQAARLLSNRHFDIITSSRLMQERAIYLLVSIINFFNAALLYLARDFFGTPFTCSY
jgi:hypothetical protein